MEDDVDSLHVEIKLVPRISFIRGSDPIVFFLFQISIPMHDILILGFYIINYIMTPRNKIIWSWEKHKHILQGISHIIYGAQNQICLRPTLAHNMHGTVSAVHMHAKRRRSGVGM